jgi:predicted Zn-dependent peptidase
MSSRLFQEIREKKGLAYSVYSFGSSYVDGGATGIYLATVPENGPEAVRLILKELKKLKEIPVGEAILRDAKEFTKAGLIMAAESVDNQMVRLAQNEIHLGCYMSMDDIIEKVEQVTSGDILRLANEIFKPSPVCLTVLGPVKDKSPYEDLIKHAF